MIAIAATFRTRANVQNARQRFLECLAACWPEVLYELDLCRDAYLTACVEYRPTLEALKCMYSAFSAFAEGGGVQCRRLVADLADWASRFGLTFKGRPAEWAIDSALTTLNFRKPGLQRWFHPVWLHTVHPAADANLVSVRTGQPEGEIPPLAVGLALGKSAVLIKVAPWRPPESERQFRVRFNR